MEKEEQFLKASENGEIDLLKRLITSGVNINTVDKNGTSALHFASWNGNRESAMFLLNNGVDPNIEEGEGWTALHDAIRKENADMLLTILSHGHGLKDIKKWKKRFYAVSNDREKHFLEMLKLAVKHDYGMGATGICGYGLKDDAKTRGYDKAFEYINTITDTP